jgi:hypothetical protein
MGDGGGPRRTEEKTDERLTEALIGKVALVSMWRQTRRER